MKIYINIIFPILALLAVQIASAKTTYSSALQTSLTSGETTTANDTYVGLWYLGKVNIGLNRNSLIAFNIKVGGENHNNSELNKTDIDLQANYVYQPNSGYFAPTFSLKLNIEQEETTQTVDKNTLSFSMYKPISNKMEYGLTYRITDQTGVSDIDSQSFILNLDYFYDPQTILYSSFIVTDEETTTTVTSGNDPFIDTASRIDLAGSHLPGEPGYVGPELTVGNHLSNSDNTSIILGAIYTIDDKQTIDIAFIKHFYDTSDNGSSSSHYLALDYFYKF